ncbi:MAG: hypothetical protein ACJAX4_001413 [Clostridium sp.]|jgi:hypothetical protein
MRFKSEKLESDKMTWNKSIEVMHTVDLIKADWIKQKN